MEFNKTVDLNDNVESYSPHTDKFLVLVNERQVVKQFFGVEIPDFCSIENGRILLEKGIRFFVISQDILKHSRNWGQLCFFQSRSYNFRSSFTKWVVRSVFPADAYYYDNGVDLEYYTIFEATCYIPYKTRSRGKACVLRKLKAPNGQIVEIDMMTEDYGDRWGVSGILVDSAAIILRSEYQNNGGRNGLVKLLLAVPPKINKK